MVIVDGDTVEGEVTERFEPCPRYQALEAEQEELQSADAGHLVEYGRNDMSLLREIELVLDEIERHHYPMYETQKLGGE